MGLQFFESTSIRLRAFDLERDRTLIYTWENDPDSWSSSGCLNPLPLNFIDRFIIESATSILEKGELSLVVENIHTREALGYIQILAYDAISRKAAVGVYIAKEYRRRGYARQSIELVQKYLKNKLACRMIYATLRSDNKASSNLFESLGYQKVASLEDWYWSDGRYYALVYYQLWLQ